MFIAFVDLPSLSVQFRVVHKFLNVRKRTPRTSKNKDEQRKATTIVTYNLKSAFDSASESQKKQAKSNSGG